MRSFSMNSIGSSFGLRCGWFQTRVIQYSNGDTLSHIICSAPVVPT